MFRKFFLCDFPAHSRRLGEIELFRNNVKVIAHLDPAIVGSVIGASSTSPGKRGQQRARQVVSMDMVGIGIMLRGKRRHARLQTGDRQAISTVNSRNAKNTDLHACFGAPSANLFFGIQPALGSSTDWLCASCLEHNFSCAISIHATGTDVYKTLW